jgi:phenylpyruvate tautomerase PptA (4-oxalocrotonate tautomerase family)
MNTKGKVKVIKKGTQQAVTTVVKVQKNAAKAASREVVANVTNWVNEFQQRRRDETRIAIEQLFGQQPQTNNV